MVQIVMAAVVAVMSIFLSSSDFNSSSSSSSSGQTSDYLVDSRVAGESPVLPGKDNAPVPEPATMALFAPVLTGLWLMRRKKS